MASLKTSPTQLPVDTSNTPCTMAAALTTNTAAEPGRGFIISANLAVQIYFADDPTTAITLTLLGGVVYPFAVYKAVFGSGSAHNLY